MEGVLSPPGPETLCEVAFQHMFGSRLQEAQVQRCPPNPGLYIVLTLIQIETLHGIIIFVKIWEPSELWTVLHPRPALGTARARRAVPSSYAKHATRVAAVFRV